MRTSQRSGDLGGRVLLSSAALADGLLSAFLRSAKSFSALFATFDGAYVFAFRGGVCIKYAHLYWDPAPCCAKHGC